MDAAEFIKNAVVSSLCNYWPQIATTGQTGGVVPILRATDTRHSDIQAPSELCTCPRLDPRTLAGTTLLNSLADSISVLYYCRIRNVPCEKIAGSPFTLSTDSQLLLGNEN